MRGTARSVEDYLLEVADLVERLGITIRGHSDIPLLEDRNGGLSFELVGDLPDGWDPGRSEVIVREAFEQDGRDGYVRTRYEYELLDRERRFRRAFHLHSPDWFERHFLVVVHEHCERPIGAVDCEHYEGTPVRDAFAGVLALMNVWTGDRPDCSTLRCLE
jgi:hypothetical protein